MAVPAGVGAAGDPFAEEYYLGVGGYLFGTEEVYVTKYKVVYVFFS